MHACRYVLAVHEVCIGAVEQSVADDVTWAAICAYRLTLFAVAYATRSCFSLALPAQEARAHRPGVGIASASTSNACANFGNGLLEANAEETVV